MSTTGAYGDPATRGRILLAAQELIAENGARIALADVAAQASVSRQSVYLHFGDRTGLLVALVQHMDETLNLGQELADVLSTVDGPALLEAAMRLNTTFWTEVHPIAQVLEAGQHDDSGLKKAWRDRMEFRQSAFRSMIDVLVEREQLSEDWTPQDAAAMLYAVAHFDTWRELVVELAWSDDRYVESMTRLLGDSLLRGNDREPAVKDPPRAAQLQSPHKRRGEMPKRKANSTRKPPEPTDDHAPIEQLIADSMPKIQPLATHLDEMIRDAIPEAQFAVKWAKAHYGLPDAGWIIEMTAYHVSVNLVFYAGAEFDPPPPLGETGRSRYVKLRTVEEVDAPEIRSWVEQAASFPGWQTDGPTVD